MDAFYAAVEVRDNNELAGKPLIIGALPSERGVVATCSYEARSYGIRSAMSIKEAYRLCPQGIYMHPNMDKYIKESKIIRDIWDAYTDLAEYVSLDEGYLDVTYSRHLFGGARRIAADIKSRTRTQTGLSCSVGVGYSMMSAKTASEEKKPDGLFVISDADALLGLISGRSVRAIYGVGLKTANTLEKNGIKTVRDIHHNEKRVRELLGKHGGEIVQLARGIDLRQVAARQKVKSIGKEHTFQEDIADFKYLRDALRLIARKLSYNIRVKGLHCKTVTLKVTFSNMVQITRRKTGSTISKSHEIFAAANELLDKVDRRHVRLIGISLSGLSTEPVHQMSIFEQFSEDKHEAVQDILLKLQYKYGIDAVCTAMEYLAKVNLNNKIEEESFNKRF
jgi:DNA polymerase-4/DNA polymerase IV (DinB-like DNA polymerase)